MEPTSPSARQSLVPVTSSIDGDVRLSDLGLAKLVQNGRGKSQGFRGKTAYAPAEQLRSQTLDCRSAREFGRSRRLAARVENPIVLHHGENGWTEPVSLRELYDAPAEVLDALRPFLPELTFLLLDLAPRTTRSCAPARSRPCSS